MSYLTERGQVWRPANKTQPKALAARPATHVQSRCGGEFRKQNFSPPTCQNGHVLSSFPTPARSPSYLGWTLFVFMSVYTHSLEAISRISAHLQTVLTLVHAAALASDSSRTSSFLRPLLFSLAIEIRGDYLIAEKRTSSHSTDFFLPTSQESPKSVYSILTHEASDVPPSPIRNLRSRLPIVVTCRPRIGGQLQLPGHPERYLLGTLG